MKKQNSLGSIEIVKIIKYKPWDKSKRYGKPIYFKKTKQQP